MICDMTSSFFSYSSVESKIVGSPLERCLCLISYLRAYTYYLTSLITNFDNLYYLWFYDHNLASSFFSQKGWSCKQSYFYSYDLISYPCWMQCKNMRINQEEGELFPVQDKDVHVQRLFCTNISCKNFIDIPFLPYILCLQPKCLHCVCKSIFSLAALLVHCSFSLHHSIVLNYFLLPCIWHFPSMVLWCNGMMHHLYWELLANTVWKQWWWSYKFSWLIHSFLQHGADKITKQRRNLIGSK